jgi:hypothetical protein
MRTREREKVRTTTVTVIRWSATALGMLALLMLVPVLLVVVFLIALRYVKPFRERIRQFNKQTFNPAVLKIAGTTRSNYGVIHHVGRRSGRSYANPIVAVPTADGFVIPLPYGVDVDWLQNVQAAGQCTMILKGNEYNVHEPELIDASTAFAMVPLQVQRVWRVMGMGTLQFLRMKRLSEKPSETPVETIV